MSNRQDGPDTGPTLPGPPENHASHEHQNSRGHSDINPNKVFDKMGSEGRSSDEEDLELAFFEKYERKNWTLTLFPGKWWAIRVNPVSFSISVCVIWGFAIWCMVKPKEANVDITDTQKWVTFTLTWAYMITQQIWVVFLIILFVSRLGTMKLGHPEDEPEFPTASWFMMMFSAGIGIGLFFFGVAEPIFHYEPCATDGVFDFAGPGSECFGNRYSQLPADDRAQQAMNLTYFHWGIHAWVTYCVVGLLLGAVVYRKDLPMTMKSAFYPILGEKIFGWMGDLVDIVSVATTLFGVCTSLGLGVQQLNSGLRRLNSSIDESFDNQAIIIWSITLLATISVVSGVKVGIRRLSEINFMFGQVIMMVALFQEDTWYLLNNLVQSTAFYLQYFVQLGSHTDTFQMAPAETLQLNGQDIHVTAVDPSGAGSERTWMNNWTIFYWGWWIAWAPFVGMFIAKISRGRTVRQIIMGSMTGPVFYGFIWFAVFGGIGLRIERQAANLGITCSAGATDDDDPIFQRIVGNQVETLNEPMIEIEGREWWRLSCRGTTDMWFDSLANFSMHKFYWGLSIASLILYFVTSSDSGSLVIDCLTANGNPHPPALQRIFWSFTEGAVAMALLKAGGTDGLQALQAVAIIAGVPYTLVICLMCKGLWDVLAEEYDKEHRIERYVYNEWATPLLDVLDFPTFTTDQAVKTLMAVVFPWYYAGKGAAWADGINPLWYLVIYGLLFISWIVLLIGNVGQAGLWALAWVCYLLFTAHMAYQRSHIRGIRDIGGNVANDILTSIIAYPLVAVQIHDEAEAAGHSMAKEEKASA